MDTALGVICALLSGAGVMYFYLQTTGGLRNYELEKDYEQQRKENKELKDLLSKERAREESAWKRPIDVPQATIDAAVSKSMDAFLKKFPPKQ